ncbi:hypothetical protein FJZ36_03325 [Candidatus Poribacteria bacterium]|nr:hypothetical protein [Candidatus Poribacteria bacterium]
MQRWVVEVFVREGLADAASRQVEHDIADLGIADGVHARCASAYWVEGGAQEADVEAMAFRLLADRIAEEAVVRIDDGMLQVPAGMDWAIEVRLKPGVTDAVGESALKGARDIGIPGVERVATGRRVYLSGPLGRTDVERICSRLLVNSVIQAYTIAPSAG